MPISFPIPRVPDLATEGAELVADWNMASDGVADWLDYAAPTTKEKRRVGTKNTLYVVATNLNGVWQSITNDPPVGMLVHIRMRILLTAGSLNFTVHDGTVSLVAQAVTSSASFQQFDYYVTSTNTSWAVRFVSSGNSTFYVDYVTVKPAQGLVGSWLNYRVRNSARDYSAYGNNGTVSATGVTWRDVGADFDGAAGNINIDTTVGDLASTTTGTWMAWITFTDVTPATNARYIICYGDTDATEMLALYITTLGYIGALAYDGGALDWQMESNAPAFTVDSKWYLVCMVQDGVSPVFYVDGIPVASTFSTPTDKTSWFSQCTGIDNGRIGCRNFASLGNDRFVSGGYMDARIYSRTLSASEIKLIYLNGVPS